MRPMMIRLLGLGVLATGAVSGKVAPAQAQTVPVELGVEVGGTPGSTTVSWQIPAGAGQFTVRRWRADQSVCCRNASPVLTANSWTDAPLTEPGAYVYRVTVRFLDGRTGFNEKQYTRPDPVSPAGFTAVQQSNAAVVLSWQSVPSAAYYILEEPASHTSASQTTTGKVMGSLPAGVHTWLVSTCYSQPPQPICSDRMPSRVTLTVKPQAPVASTAGSSARPGGPAVPNRGPR